MKKYLLAIALLTLLILPSNVFACYQDGFNEQRRIASLMRLTYEFNPDNNRFNVTIRNFHRGFFYMINDEQVMPPVDHTTGISDVRVGQFNEGDIVDITVYPRFNYGCSQAASRLYQRLPFFNPFYTNEVCNDLEDCEFCERLTTQRLSEDVFLTGVRVCATEQAQVTEVEPVAEEETYSAMYYVIFASLGIFVIAIALITYYFIFRKRKALKRGVL